MIRIRDLILQPGEDPALLLQAAARQLRCAPQQILSLKIVKASIDARKKEAIRQIYTVDVTVKGAEARCIAAAKNPKVSKACDRIYVPPLPGCLPAHRPVIVGFGPAGMFATLLLTEAGLRPIVLERGERVETRQKLVETFWQTGQLDPHCNVQFGEGGAGTFSDGKLNTGTKDFRIGYVLKRLVEFGAPEEICYQAKPHIGTDVLIRVVRNLRNYLLAHGAQILFGARLAGLQQADGKLQGIFYEDAQGQKTLACQHLILAIGHSARDTFQMLLDAGVPLEAKPFSMGVRIEHAQRAISRAQYGTFAPLLPPADYKLSCHLPDGTSAYTFCMCPGGYVVAAASEAGHVATNGMSYAARDGENANSALLVTLQPADFPFPGPLGGMQWQRQIEAQAFLAGGSTYRAPAQLLCDFLQNCPSRALGSVLPTYRPGVVLCNLHDVLPPRITNTLQQAILHFDRQLRDFAAPDAVLTAPETRSSSPVRIVRDQSFQSLLRGLFPCGEGAGYAGGITSAAVDGLRCAEALLTAAQ